MCPRASDSDAEHIRRFCDRHLLAEHQLQDLSLTLGQAGEGGA
jgi:hypothetical protein